MAKPYDKLMPALPPAAPTGHAETASADLELAAAAPSGPGWALAGVLVLAMLLMYLRFLHPARRLQRALRRLEAATAGQHHACRAQALHELVRAHGLRPDAAWHAALDRLRFEPVAPAQAEALLQQLSAQVPEMRRT